MKKFSLLNKIVFSVACLFGVGGMAVAGVSTFSAPSKVIEANAATEKLEVGNHNLLDGAVFNGTTGTAQYNASTKTLALKNFSYTGATSSSYSTGIDYYPCLGASNISGLIITLEGTNTLTCNSNFNSSSIALSNVGSPVIKKAPNATETPSLVLKNTSTSSSLRYCYGLAFNGPVDTTLTIEDCNVSNNNVSCQMGNGGIFTGVANSVTVKNSTLNLKGKSVSSADGNSYGMDLNGHLTVINSTINATGGNCASGASSYGIDISNVAGQKLFLKTGGVVNATGGEVEGGTSRSVGIALYSIDMDGGELNATGGYSNKTSSYGIELSADITLKSGRLSAIGTSGYLSGTERVGIANYLSTNVHKVTVESNFGYFYVAGSTRATTAKIATNYDGKASTSVDGSTWTTIKKNTSGSDYSTYKRLLLSKLIYTASANGPFTYDGLSHESITVNVTNPLDAIVTYKLSTDTNYSATVPSFTDAGEYDIDYKITATNYDTKTGQVTFEINKASVTWTTTPVGASGLMYDGTEHDLIQTAGAASLGTVKYSVNNGDFTTDLPKATNAGEYNIVCKVEVDDNHDAPSNVNLKVTVAKAPNAYTTVPQGISDLVYDGTSHALVTAGEAEHGTVQYKVNNGQFSSNVSSVTNAGTYKVTVRVQVDGNYETPAQKTINVTIAKAANEFTTVPEAVEGIVYDGTSHALVSAGTAKGGTVQYKVNDGKYGNDVPTVTNAGEYTVYYKVNGGTNYNNVAEQSVVVTVAKADAEVTAPTVVEGLKYTGEPQVLIEAGSTTGGTIKYSLDGENYDTNVPSVTDTGEYIIYYKVDGGTNYNDIPAESLSVSISENDKTLLNSVIDEADLYYESIKEANPAVAEVLKEHLDAAKLVSEDPNQTVKQIEDATKDLIDALYNAQVEAVVANINNIGTVTYPDSKDSIDYARNTYNALADDQKELVANYQDLLDAEALYNDYEKANAVKVLIEAIGKVELSDECKAKIDAARGAYDVLTDAQKGYVANYQDLLDAEALYADYVKAEEVKVLIDAIGKVELTDTCKGKIDAAKAAYDALTDAQKELVTNKKVLSDDIELYNILAHQPTVVDNGVKVEGKDGDLIPVNVTVKVEVKTSVQAQQGTTGYNNIQKLLGGNQKISGVYDVKLMRTVGDVVTEIQPSDIKPGMIIIVEITLPDGLEIEGLKVLHIHSEDDISYVENFKIDAGKLTFETDRLSEIAFVTPAPNAFPVWAIALIIIGGLLLLCCLFFLVMFIFFPRYIIDYKNKKVIRTIYVKKHYDMVLLLDTHLRKVRRNEADVYKNKADAETNLK